MPTSIDALRQQAREQHLKGNTVGAVRLLTQAIQQAPSDADVVMDMAQIFLDINEIEQAKSLFDQLPEAARQSEMGKTLLGQLTFRELAAKTQGKVTLLEIIKTDSTNLDAHFDLAICYVAEHNYTQAVENLFAVLKQDADYKEGAAREMVINLCNMLSDNEPDFSKNTRKRLASMSH